MRSTHRRMMESFLCGLDLSHFCRSYRDRVAIASYPGFLPICLPLNPSWDSTGCSLQQGLFLFWLHQSISQFAAREGKRSALVAWKSRYRPLSAEAASSTSFPLHTSSSHKEVLWRYFAHRRHGSFFPSNWKEEEWCHDNQHPPSIIHNTDFCHYRRVPPPVNEFALWTFHAEPSSSPHSHRYFAPILEKPPPCQECSPSAQLFQ